MANAGRDEDCNCGAAVHVRAGAALTNGNIVAVNDTVLVETKQAPPLEPPGLKSAPRICKTCHLPFYDPMRGRLCTCPKPVAASGPAASRVSEETLREIAEDFYNVPVGDIEDAARELLALRESHAALVPFAEWYANWFPRWTDSSGVVQDPNGIHAILARAKELQP